MKESIGEYIRKLRLENGYTLTQLGAFLGIDSGALSKIETGKKIIDQKTLPKLAEIFDLDLSFLKEELLSERIAYEVLDNSCTENVLQLAEQKIKYLKVKQSRQIELNLQL